ncbi:MAG: alpha-L-fucosidase [Opitutales bacterium]|nr:alpha-L-fucosidase [Opitutales bacterium]
MKPQKTLLLLLSILSICACSPKENPKYEASFESLEQANPTPEWFKDAKFGIYFHWGVYSVPAYGNEWYPRNMYNDGSGENKHHTLVYGEITQWPYNNFIESAKDKDGNFVQFAPKLKSEGGQFDPEEWAQLFADSGAKFAGPVAEHHDGFSMWASKANSWNAKEMGPKLDLVKLLTDAIREKKLKIILSMHHAYNITGFYEWAPQVDDPKLKILYGQQGKEKNEALWLEKHKEIIDSYQPDIIWQDFNLHEISQPVLLQFLAYYYNQAASWNKEVVATFKDGLNTDCAVLDYERGGPIDITENYWLTDDAISSSSWCYTEGLRYYSVKQVFHGFLDRVSKNGNLLLNISPKADGSIPQEQKDILLAMGAWLKKYGEAVYSTRAWDVYGEGPTKMGANHGVFTQPKEGTADDVRYTRSKDNKTLYAILLGWNEGQEEMVLRSLPSDRIDLKTLKTVTLINGESGKYLPLCYKQDTDGLHIQLPEKSFEEMAYVIKLSFADRIADLDRYTGLDENGYYNIIAGSNLSDPVLSSELSLAEERYDSVNQWKFSAKGKGLYRIINRKDASKVLSCEVSGSSFPELMLSHFTGDDAQLWRVADSFNGLSTISNKAFPDEMISVSGENLPGENVEVVIEAGNASRWRLMKVCELEQRAFKHNTIPGTIEAEDFDIGCPGDAYFDTDEMNSGGKYREDQYVDIEADSSGNYLVGWINSDEWLEYTVSIDISGSYQALFYVASIYDTAKFHLMCDGKDVSGILSVPNTADWQNWVVVSKELNLESGEHVLRLFFDEGSMNVDKMVFQRDD